MHQRQLRKQTNKILSCFLSRSTIFCPIVIFGMASDIVIGIKCCFPQLSSYKLLWRITRASSFSRKWDRLEFLSALIYWLLEDISQDIYILHQFLMLQVCSYATTLLHFVYAFFKRCYIRCLHISCTYPKWKDDSFAEARCGKGVDSESTFMSGKWQAGKKKPISGYQQSPTILYMHQQALYFTNCLFGQNLSIF